MATPPFTSGANWSWPSDEELRNRASEQSVPGAFAAAEPEVPKASAGSERVPPKTTPRSSSSSRPQPRRHYGPRTCRICLDVVQPTFEPAEEALPGYLNPGPRVVYVDPELGRLLCPCKCKGSQKYVHESCLHAWRVSDGSLNSRKFLECPTCGFRYRAERVVWSNWIGSTVTQIGLTCLILFLTIFVLGFVADPIINLYLDPYDTILSSTPMSKHSEEFIFNDEPSTWTEHLVKGLASLGLLGFLKVFVAMSPWQWWNLRSSGLIGGGRRGNTGRDRLESISWTLVVIGIVTFLWAVWKGVRAWTRRFLEYARDKVADVQSDEGDDDDDESTER